MLGQKYIDHEQATFCAKEDRQITMHKCKVSPFGVRHVQVVMAWIAICIGYILRVNMSVAIVAMTDKFDGNSSDLNQPRAQVYDWSEAEKSRLLSGFFWGYLLLPILMGNIAETYGVKTILGLCMILASVFTALVPIAATQFGYLAVLVLRVLLGLIQGSLFPCVNVLVSKWVVPKERARCLAFCFSGSFFGPAISFPLSGFLASSSGGWPTVFYVTGGLSIMWTSLWLWLGSSTPKDNQYISDAEKKYIETSIQHDVKLDSGPSKTPWKRIWMSLPLWAIAASHFGFNFAFWTLVTETPNYIHSVLDVNIKDNGILSALPYMSACVAFVVYSFISEAISRHAAISQTVSRKIWNSLCLWGGAVPLLVLGIIDVASTRQAILLLILATVFMTAEFFGFLTNHIDLSPNFCGTLIGITNMISSSASILGPLCVGWILEEESFSESKWKIVFLTVTVIMFATNLIYLVFGSAKLQSWNALSSDDPPKMDKKQGIEDC